MTFYHGRSIICALLFAGSITCVADVAAQTDTPLSGRDADAVAKFTDLDSKISQVKQDSLELYSSMLARERALLYPDYSRVTVLVGVQLNDFVLESVRISIDDGAETEYRYSPSEAVALLKTGLHPIVRTNLNLGPHRLTASFSGRFSRSAPDSAPLTGRIETIFEKTLSGLDVVIPVARDRRTGNPVFGAAKKLQISSGNSNLAAAKVTPDGVDSYVVGGELDPNLSVARFYAEDGRYFSAVSELLLLARAVSDPSTLPAEYLWALSDAYVGFGMRKNAADIYRQLATLTTDHERLNKARIALASLEHERGYHQEASLRLLRMREKVPQSLVVEWQDLLARALMAQDRYNDAAEVLTDLDNAKKHDLFMRYNLAVARYNDGNVTEATSQIDKIGKIKPTDKNELALRDKANLVLGYHFLRKEEGGTAKPLFERVQSEGVYSNRALLGLGWAELAPRGERQSKSSEQNDKDSNTPPYSGFSSLGILIRPGFFDPDLSRRLGVEKFRLGKIAKQDEEALLRALVPWAELAKRDRMDDAVQEGLLAIPYALDRLGAHQQALQYYLTAVDALEEARSRVDEGVESVNRSTMIETIVRRDLDSESGREWRLQDLPDLPETYWLESLIASNLFQESLKNYRDIRMVARALDSWSDRLPTLSNTGLSLPEMPPEAAISRVRKKWIPKNPPPVKLKTSDRLDFYASSAKTVIQNRPVQLELGRVPIRFEGAREQLVAMRPMIAAVRPLLSDVGKQQQALLQDVSIKELQAQKKRMTDYLLEARFAIARIYDRQISGVDRDAILLDAKDKK